MNRRQRKKNDREAVAIAKTFRYCIHGKPTFWSCNSHTTRSATKQPTPYQDETKQDYKEEQRAKEILLKVARTCVREAFPIQDYCLFEIPYGDKNGRMLYFVKYGKSGTITKEISFWCPFDSPYAIPQAVNEHDIQCDAETCKKAVVLVQP